MKALLLYSHVSGWKNVSRRLSFVKKRLHQVFESLEVVCTLSVEEASRLEGKACGVYDVLVVVGGDGTFNNAVNELMKHENPPILAYLNFGTIGDVGRNFGIHGSVRNALRIIEKGNIEPFDVGEINGSYFAYGAAIGRYSDISYKVQRNKKKKAGRLAYYAEAFRQAFQRKRVSYMVRAEGKEYSGQTPFLLLLNGKFFGGFLIDPRGRINDGKMELYLTKPGLFNGLVNYFFHVRTQKIAAQEFEISTSEDGCWCLDGERGPSGPARVSLHPRALRIFSKKLT
jgi:diacylglycerol kinase (ATP)